MVTEEQAKSRIQPLIDSYNAIDRTHRPQLTEANVVRQFVDPLFQALGWPIGDHERYKYEETTLAGRPDIVFIPDGAGTIFVEAKRFGRIKELEQARKTLAGTLTPGQLSLPGMAADRTAEEQQAINYAFKNGGRWAILTNFERLRLFNARRDWLVLSFETPRAYLDDFDLLWQLSHDNIARGSLDRLSNQRHREDVDTEYLAFINEWRERLAQNILENQTKNWWAFDDDGNLQLDRLRAVVQRVLDRLVVIRFAEDHLIIPAGTLYTFYELSQTNPYTFDLSDFFQKLYRRFDHYHNSNLFAAGLADQAVFSDRVLADLVRKLYEARYRAMSADIMGNTYEQYLGKTLAHDDGTITTRDNLETRKKQGSYYTPQVIVRYLVDNSLGRYLYGTANGRSGGDPLDDEERKTANEIRDLTVIDPACGSGGFLIYAYHVLAGFYRGEIERLKEERDRQIEEHAKQVESGEITAVDMQMVIAPLNVAIERLERYPHLILENHLYGVDLDPQAAELATVNLIMQAMADQRDRKRLPLILNQNIKVGNSLVGAGPQDDRYADHAGDLAALRRLRLDLRTAPAGEHEAIMAQIEEIEEQVNRAINEDLNEYFDDVHAHRPFHWAAEFPEAFVDDDGEQAGAAAGFDVVIGNPPWEVVKPDLREYYSQFDPDIESKLNSRQV